MKRGTITHHKTDRLARTLGVGRWGAVGILESLWHATAERTPQGNIGHLTDKEIAYYIGWDGDCTALVDALVECGWLERSDVHRLLVHDWHDHADDATKKRLSRNGIGFLTGHVQSCPDNGGQRRTTADTSSPGSGHVRLPEPEPEPDPEPLPIPEPEPSGVSQEVRGDALGSGRRAGRVAKALIALGVNPACAEALDAGGVTALEVESTLAEIRKDGTARKPIGVLVHRLSEAHSVKLPKGPQVSREARDFQSFIDRQNQNRKRGIA